jgi:hypothetical protein
MCAQAFMYDVIIEATTAMAMLIIAARLQQLAKPAGISISAPLDYVRHRPASNRGDERLKYQRTSEGF